MTRIQVVRFMSFVSMLTTAACAPRVSTSEAAAPRFAVIPVPARMTPRQGALVLDGSVRIQLPPNASPNLANAARQWAAAASAETGRDIQVAPFEANARPTVRLRLEPGRTGGVEAYLLVVQQGGVTISAGADAGLFYGLQTLRQLLPPAGGSGRLAAVEIEDAPRFGYRGMHLDASRHFFPAAFVKKYIDLMALYKLNTFHWHLTEDQGWRLEIQRYPRLASVGGCRRETMLLKNFTPFVGDGVPVCGFYTQAEAKEIVEYARQRFITVIPEIEMPGHAMAALAAYPELACTTGPFEVATRWGVFEDIFCPKEETFTFLENVLGEVTDIFPSKYVHIGGDEVPKKRWKESDVAQNVMRREGLKDEHELQSYFIRRIEHILNTRGRRLIGWDEILEGGLAPDATVMSWRGIEGGIAAAKQGHDVIMTPNSHLYFDHYQGDAKTEPLAIGGFSPLEKVYAFEPMPPELTAEEARHILGAQANVWTEYMKTSDQVEYMVFPRLLALSEVVWSPREKRDWPGFQSRLVPHLARLDRIGVRHHR